MEQLCNWCDRTVHFDEQNGQWIHQGGAHSVMFCPDCAYICEQPKVDPHVCPNCSGDNLREDHEAQPGGVVITRGGVE